MFPATKGPPTYRLRGLRYPGPYVIASVDPDAPTPENPSVAQIRHYLGGNFKTVSRRGDLKNDTEAITEFLQPSPPSYSSAHR